MIAPKVARPTKTAETAAYELATLRDENTCQRCHGACGPIARDHRKNRSQTGRTAVENLQLLGMLCHLWKSEHPDEANREGWGVPGWANPAEYPARRWVRTEVGTRRLAWVIYVPDTQYFSHPSGFRGIDELEAASRIAGLWDGVAA